MVNKRSVILLLVCIFVLLTGCNPAHLYDTEVQGTYQYEAYTAGNEGTPDILYKLSLKSDDTYEYYMLEYATYDNPEENTYEGKVVSVEEINKDITKITLDEEIYTGSLAFATTNAFYKYKNLIGEYYPADIKKHSDFFIQTGENENEGYFFNAKEKTAYKQFDVNGQLNKSDTYKYKFKQGAIWIEVDEINGYQPLYFIVKGGAFESKYSKQG